LISVRITVASPGLQDYTGSGRSRDWWAQGVNDLEMAEECRVSSRHAWACFAAHQAAEKAVKALHIYLGQQATGNVVASLITGLPDFAVTESESMDWARVLENYYIAARSPDAHAEEAPYERYGSLQSHNAVVYARNILEFVLGEVA